MDGRIIFRVCIHTYSVLEEGVAGDLCGDVMGTLVTVESALAPCAAAPDGLLGQLRYDATMFAKDQKALAGLGVVATSETDLTNANVKTRAKLDHLAGLERDRRVFILEDCKTQGRCVCLCIGGGSFSLLWLLLLQHTHMQCITGVATLGLWLG